MHICLSFGKSKSRLNGLGEFSLHVANNVAKLIRPEVELTVYANPSFEQSLHPEINFCPQAPWDRLRFGKFRGITVWHTLSHFFWKPPPTEALRLVTIHDLNYKSSSKARRQRRGQKRIRRALRLHDRAVSGSVYAANDIQTSFQLETPLDVVLDGATSLVGCPMVKPGGVLEGPFLFHVSRMAASKNTACILDLIRGWPEMNFVLAGRSHPDTRNIQATLERENLFNAQVLFDITEEKKAWLYDNSAGFLFPSLTEGFGLPAVEAMHFGKPVFLSRLTSLPEVGGDQAFYLDSFDAASVKSIIEPAIVPAQARSRAKEVMAHAAQFNWGRCAAEYLAIYAQMAGVPVDSIANVG